MNQQEKQIRIAEACGWKFKINNYNSIGTLMCKLDEKSCWIMPAEKVIPDYFGDLNACHEMEEVIKEDSELWATYGCELGQTILGKRWWIVSAIAHATAAQRAEAFGRTLGLWKKGE